MTKYITWYVKSRNKLDVFIGVDEHEDFKSKKWTDKNGNSCYNFWDTNANHPRTAVNYTIREVQNV